MKYFPNLHISKLDDGGYIIHGSNDIAKDYEAYGFAAHRVTPVATLLVDTGWKAYLPCKYDNWLELAFPLTPQYTELPLQLPVNYVDVSDDIQHAVVLAERHLVYDRIFENWLPTQGVNLPDFEEMDMVSQMALYHDFKLQQNFHQY